MTRTKGELVVSQPKTHNSIRVLPVSQQAVELLVEEHKKHPGNPYMFPSPKTGGMFDPDSFRPVSYTHLDVYKRQLQQILDLLLRVVNIAGDMRNGLVGQHIRCVSKIVLLCLVQSLGPIQEQQLKEYMHIG